MACVYEDKYVDEVFSFAEVVLYHLFPAAAVALGYFCVAIAGEVDEIPLDGWGFFFGNCFYFEMVDELCFAGGGGGFGEVLLIAKHVDEGGFAYVAAANECELRPVGRGALVERSAGDEVFGFFEDHSTK